MIGRIQIMLRAASATALLAAGLCSGADLATGQEPPSFPTEASAITVDVVVMDKQGAPVTDLTQGDFVVTDDGEPQAITAFEVRDLARDAVRAAPEAGLGRVATNQGAAASQGRILAFVIDDASLTPLQGLPAVKKALKEWLRESADPRDEVTLVTTSGDVWWSTQVEQGRDDLLAVVDRIAARRPPSSPAETMTDWEAAQIATFATPAAGCSGLLDIVGASFCRVVKRWAQSGACGTSSIPGGGSAGDQGQGGGDAACKLLVIAHAQLLHDRTLRRERATLGTVARLSEGWSRRRGRKSIFVFSEGFIDVPQANLAGTAVAAAQSGNAAVYYVDVRGLRTDSLYSAEQRGAPSAGDVAAMTLDDFAGAAGGESLAEATGGFAVVNTNDVLPGLTRGTEESGHYYLLGYPLPHPHDGRWHELQVRVSRPGMTVRARRGYVASPERDLAAADESADEAARDGSSLLDPALMVGAIHDRIPLRLAARAVARGQEGTRVLVGLDVDTTPLTFVEDEGTRQRATLDVTLLGVSRDRPGLSPVEQRVTLRSDRGPARPWWAYTSELELPAGPAQIKAMVRDPATGLVGTVTQRLDVPSEVPVAPHELEQSVGCFQFEPRGGQRSVQVLVEAMPPATDAGSGSHLAVRGRIENRAGRTVEEWTHQWEPSAPALGNPSSLSWRRALALPPGEYLFESAVIDVASGAISVGYEPFAIPASSDLALSSIVLLGEGAPMEEGSSAPDDPLVVGSARFSPLLDRRIAHGTPQLPLLVRVYSDAATPAELALTLLHDDKPLATLPVPSPEPDAAGHVVWLGTLPLTALPPGDYALVLAARRGAEAAETRTAFEIVAASPSRSAQVDRAAEATTAPKVDDPELAAVLAKAGHYVEEYANVFRDLVAEERYQQNYYPTNQPAQSCITRADIVFVTLGGPFLWGTFRDIHHVNGHEVRDREGRLERLFLRGDQAAMEEARAIRTESARYNIGVPRTINEPTLPLMFLHPRNQRRFSFSIKGRDRVGERDALEVTYRETQHPTMISDARGKSVPNVGTFWIDPQRGTVLRTEIRLGAQVNDMFVQGGIAARIDVRYREEPGLSIFVPDEMNESYSSTYARARYSNYRRFTVTTREAIGVAPKE